MRRALLLLTVAAFPVLMAGCHYCVCGACDCYPPPVGHDGDVGPYYNATYPGGGHPAAGVPGPAPTQAPPKPDK